VEVAGFGIHDFYQKGVSMTHKEIAKNHGFDKMT